MKSSKFKKTLSIISVFILILLSAFSISASADQASFYVNAILPNNQKNSGVTYFDLNMNPDQKQTLEVQVNNKSDKEIIVDVGAVSASTNSNGVIDYKTPDIRDETLKIPFSEICKAQQTVITVPAKSHKIAKFDLAMPSDKYDGVILGGFSFTKRLDSQDGSESSNGIQLHNKFSYVIGVVLSETKTVVNPDFELLSVEAGIVEYAPKYVYKIRNKEPSIAKNMKMKAIIYTENKQDIIVEKDVSDVNMAPNSVMDYGITYTDEKLPPGKFLAYLKIELDGEIWEFDQAFEVKDEEADNINDNALITAEAPPSTAPTVIEQPETNKIPQWVFALIGILIFFILLLLFLLLFMKRRKKEEEEEEKNKFYH